MRKTAAAAPSILGSPAVGARLVCTPSFSPQLDFTDSQQHPSLFHFPTNPWALPPTMSGSHKFKYPGIDLPLRESDEGDYEVAAYLAPEATYESSSILQIREVAMMILMDRLTDKRNWHEKVFNQDIVDAWRRDAFAQSEDEVYRSIVGHKDGDVKMLARTRIISEKAFENCIAELRNKAAFFKDTGLIPTLDADQFTIIKSDTLVTPDLHQALQASFAKLMADQASNPDWHPWTQDVVWDIVHPSMYPFVYNRSRFIHEEVVGVSDAIDRWSGKGQIPVQNLETPLSRYYPSSLDDIPDEFWSEKYQWLPANLAFQEDGSVKFTSYINNLHPQRYSDVYTVIEKLIDTAIPAWDRTLDWNWDSTTCVTRFDPPPECREDTPEDDLWEKFDPEILEAAERDSKVSYGELYLEDYVFQKHWKEMDDADEGTKKRWREEAIPQVKWINIRDPILPEPVHVRQYNANCRENIREKFKETGLQVIVKMASIELTPEKPSLPPGGWHVEGHLNEHIVATALYYIDEENIEPTALSFRQFTSQYQDDLQQRVGQDMYEYYNRIFGVSLGYTATACLQNYGSIETKPGRLLVFRNTFHHRVSGCTLKDKTKPGHRRFIALWLVNPAMRIISTANVPPQQLDWWLDSVIGDVKKGVKGQVPPEILQLMLEKKGEDVASEPRAGISVESMKNLTGSHPSSLPPEILDMIRENQSLDALMTVEEARQHRLALMEERSQSHRASESSIPRYNAFCEH